MIATIPVGTMVRATYLGVKVQGIVSSVIKGTVYNSEKRRYHLVLTSPVRAFGQTFSACLVEGKDVIS